MATTAKSGPSAPSAATKAANDYLDTVRSQLTSVVKQSQQLVLDTVGSLTEAAGKLTPSLPSLPSLPFVPTSAEVSEYVSAGFDIAAELLASQREFATALVAKLAPSGGPAS
jgi:hypothetical protein